MRAFAQCFAALGTLPCLPFGPWRRGGGQNSGPSPPPFHPSFTHRRERLGRRRRAPPSRVGGDCQTSTQPSFSSQQALAKLLPQFSGAGTCAPQPCPFPQAAGVSPPSSPQFAPPLPSPSPPPRRSRCRHTKAQTRARKASRSPRGEKLPSSRAAAVSTTSPYLATRSRRSLSFRLLVSAASRISVALCLSWDGRLLHKRAAGGRAGEQEERACVRACVCGFPPTHAPAQLGSPLPPTLRELALCWGLSFSCHWRAN